MKVLMLNGSGNANGSTRAGLDIMAEVFAANGVDSEIVCVGAKPVRDCIGCNQCAEQGKCVFQDDGVNEFVEKAMAADGFVFGTPVYYAHPSGRILSFLDRAFFSNMWGTGAAAQRKQRALAGRHADLQPRRFVRRVGRQIDDNVLVRHPLVRMGKDMRASLIFNDDGIGK